MGKVLARFGLGGLLVLLVAFVIGCGGDDSSSGDDSSTASETSGGDTTTTAEPDVTQKDFVKAADKECQSRASDFAKALNQSDAAQATASSPETLASADSVEKAANKVADITEEIADIKREITKRLSKLETPDPKALEQLVKARNIAEDDIDDLADAWRAYGKNPMQKTSDAIAAAQKANAKSANADGKVAEKMGLKVCGQPIKRD